MDNKRYAGKLIRWNDDRGFGFITSADSDSDVFLHISALINLARRPAVGDTIEYVVRVDKNGKYKAVNARIKGVATVRSVKTGTSKKNRSRSAFPQLILVLIFAFAAYKIFSGQGNLPNRIKLSNSLPGSSAKKKDASKRYSCQGKIHCSEMTSCEEAKFYQRNCPGTKMDGDGDGIPCERQWCGY